LFGGAPGIARAAAEKLNAAPSGLSSVGWLDPGFGAVEEMSQDLTIDRINASQADFLVVSLGANKGQLWLHRNHRRLKIPIRAHLGAVLNFEAGTINRAPPILRACGLEWLWRLKEEPYLWRRYAHDGSVLLRLLSTCILPLAILNRWYLFKSNGQSKELSIITEQNHDSVTIRLAGYANESNIASAITFFRETLIKQKANVVLDLTRTHAIDGRFFGLLLMLRKNLKNQGAKLQFVGISPTIRRLFWLNGLNFLLEGATE
jgi:N-acetylglucosaminyldiphosphoundecaprenol N-acetyl-beta-D-mannosaminyltransferase